MATVVAAEVSGSGITMWVVEPSTPGMLLIMDRSEASPLTPKVVPVGTPFVNWASSRTPRRSTLRSSFSSAYARADATIFPLNVGDLEVTELGDERVNLNGCALDVLTEDLHVLQYDWRSGGDVGYSHV